MPNLPAAMYIFFTTGVQSENPTFLGVRSTNPLPAASGLVKLTNYCITSWFKAVTNELVWFGIKAVGVPLSYYWHTLGCAVKHLLMVITNVSNTTMGMLIVVMLTMTRTGCL